MLRPKVSSESNHDEAATEVTTWAALAVAAGPFTPLRRIEGRVLVGGPRLPLPEPGVFLMFAAFIKGGKVKDESKSG